MSKLDWFMFGYGGCLFVFMTILTAWGCFFVLPAVFFLAWTIRLHGNPSTPTGAGEQ
jgi:hypothetical protein